MHSRVRQEFNSRLLNCTHGLQNKSSETVLAELPNGEYATGSIQRSTAPDERVNKDVPFPINCDYDVTAHHLERNEA
jgi:hypothetical protein